MRWGREAPTFLNQLFWPADTAWHPKLQTSITWYCHFDINHPITNYNDSFDIQKNTGFIRRHKLEALHCHQMCLIKSDSSTGGRLLMCLEVADPGESFPTAGTDEGFLSCVNSLVFLQVACLCEQLPTCITPKGSLPCMHPLVCHDIGQPRESLSTVLTNVTFPPTFVHVHW